MPQLWPTAATLAVQLASLQKPIKTQCIDEKRLVLQQAAAAATWMRHLLDQV
jgi:hypothetical protein